MGFAVALARELFDATLPYAIRGAYVSFMTAAESGRVVAAYGQNDERLVGIKDKYDPDNLFQFNQNIVPSGGWVAPLETVDSHRLVIRRLNRNNTSARRWIAADFEASLCQVDAFGRVWVIRWLCGAESSTADGRTVVVTVRE
jgi:hypothetical protein